MITAPLTDSTQHGELTRLIQSEIEKSGGFLRFSRFMELALYAPRLGYYNADTQKFGQKGDFITAPLLSPLFSQCFANAFQPFLNELPSILEIGAGSGIFAKDVLLALEKKQTLPDRYFIFEISESLRSQQKLFLQESIPHLFSRIEWLNELPKNFSGIVFANEVLDAMPFDIFKISENKIYEKVVVWKNQFAWELKKPSAEMENKISPLFTELPFEYESEIRMGMNEWIANLANSLEKAVIFFVDYGYRREEFYHADRGCGTMKCFYQHQSHDDPFLNVGLQDMTAHVDFTDVAECAVRAGLTLNGMTTQANFLMENGILEMGTPEQSFAMKQLLLPGQMGEIVKVIRFTRG
jgi:SAM-dependent MidA family methyltransferase